MSSHGARVGWLGGLYVSIIEPPIWLFSSASFIIVVGHEGDVGGVVVFGQGEGERGRDRRCKGME